jgi:hypothetical protein
MKANDRRMIAKIYKWSSESLVAINPPLIPPTRLTGIIQKDSRNEICLCFNRNKKLENELTVLETLFAPIAEWIGTPSKSIAGRLINPPPPANVPIVVAIAPMKKSEIVSILNTPCV